MTDTTQLRLAPNKHRDHRETSRLSIFNAWFFDSINGYANHIADAHKRAAFDGIEPGRILEIGAGTGANFSFLPPRSTILALEPNPAMHQALQRRAIDHGMHLELLTNRAETLPLDDDSVDTVISTLVLCTVDNPDAVLREVKRVLRPGGTFRFVEHVAAHPASPRRWLQRALVRPWAWLFEGCQLERHTADAIDAAGFADVNLHRGRFRHSVFVPVNRAISGVATKSATRIQRPSSRPSST
jgi:ubiquinone/menaquinone biosynthesis C-methylase UbiE